MIQHKITINTKSFNLRVQPIGQSIWFHFKGKTFVIPANKKKFIQTNLTSVKPLSTSVYKQTTSKGEKGIILSPMPGKIVKIFVKKGSQVKKNQSLLALSAMKMEYSVQAPFRAKVLKVHVNEGDTVAMDQTLIQLL